MNIVIDNYNINIIHNPVLNKLKDIEYYKKIPDLFLTTYTNLEYEDIEEILKNEELTNVVLEEVYKNLNINDETKFIKIVNNSLEILNSFAGVLIVCLQRYYGYKLYELIKLSPEEILTMFIIELKTGKPLQNIDIEKLKEVLLSVYSKDTVNDFVENCCSTVVQQNIEQYEKEFQELQNL